MELDPKYVIRKTGDLTGLYDRPFERSVKKQLDHLDEHCMAFIAASPLVIVATESDGMMDCSPRGDRPGFIQVPDEKTLLIPDRRGNNRLDTLSNLVLNPKIGLLFIVPGVRETFRVNGTATLSQDPALTSKFEVQGKAPRTVIVVEVLEAFVHCSRALVRADVWNPATFGANPVPTFGTMMAAHTKGLVEAAAFDEEAKVRVPQTLY